VRLAAGDVRVAGTLIGPANRERLVEAWGFPIDMEPTDHMLFFRYGDRPGIVGLIGNALGAGGVNIASMQVGRLQQGGDALIAMAVDSAVPPRMVAEIAQRIGAADARSVDLA
jgi:D-3-phosphoglycerate dehydrogenase